MSEEITCPHCGAPLAAGLSTPPVPAPARAGSSDEIGGEADPEPVALLASGSNDDSFAATPFGHRLGASEPDPLLGEFVSPSSAEVPGPSVEAAPEGPGPALRSGSGTSFPSIDLEARPPATPARAPVSEAEDEDEDEDEPPRGTPWSTVLLASYASAVTLALGWTLANPRGGERDLTDRSATAPAPPTGGHQASLSRTVAPPEPILAEHQAALGKPLRVGSLEVTPLEVRREGVTLQKKGVTGQVERRDGGKGALVLRLKLRNTSDGSVFAPLDQAYLRERDKEVVDSFVEAASGERIYPYPLAVESEWSIVGQEFDELRPGEARVVSVVTVPDAPGDPAGPFAWRVRLRTGIGRTDVVGLRWPEPKAAPSK